MIGILGLLYHDVFDGARYPDASLGSSAAQYHIDSASFREQVSLVVQSGIPVLGLAELQSSILTGVAPRGCFFSFDDGWHGSVAVAGPILAEFAVPALLFVTSDFIGRPRFIDSALLRTASEGTFEIGCHGKSHRMLSSLSRSELRRELCESRDAIEQMIGREVRSLSIPGGATSEAVRAEAKAAGYDMIFDSQVGLNPTKLGTSGIGRVPVKYKTESAALTRWLNGNLRREIWRAAVLGFPKGILGMRRYSHLRRLVLGDVSRATTHDFEP